MTEKWNSYISDLGKFQMGYKIFVWTAYRSIKVVFNTK